MDKTELRDLSVAAAMGLVSITDPNASYRDQVLQGVHNQLEQWSIQTPTVGQVKKAIDPSDKMGLTAEVADLFVLAYAIAHNKELMRGGPIARRCCIARLTATRRGSAKGSTGAHRSPRW